MSRLTIVQIVLKMLNLFLLQNKGTVRRIEVAQHVSAIFALTCRTILISGIFADITVLYALQYHYSLQQLQSLPDLRRRYR